ncbi:MAG: ABC transporter permease, partial [Mesorhizobium sp.]
MLSFVLRRLGTMALTMLCLTMIVFFLINLEPNLKKLAISQTEMHTSAEQLEDWLINHGYR